MVNEKLQSPVFGKGDVWNNKTVVKRKCSDVVVRVCFMAQGIITRTLTSRRECWRQWHGYRRVDETLTATQAKAGGEGAALAEPVSQCEKSRVKNVPRTLSREFP
ncbi:hypothetical protein [Paraburkholderia strydomiana]|uniref:hypothetical protein n=1 Tax=Paraburkholderia strydomiana TaxID=1245417 RepID=UPI001BEAC97B|nr:hypothetical protein [Paraburkholderia strydomiana]MBT2791054.1 hypothetical protein [Paraburkholderia strydomiana]